MHSGPQPQVPSSTDALLRRLVDSDGLLSARYRPIEVLGQGGMGVVFSALDERIGREVAIKSLRPELAGDREFVTRFAAEASTLARVHHPNVVQILDVSGPHDTAAFYVMELVRGTALSRLVRERGRLAWEHAFDVLSQAAAALATVHRAGVIHRDLKPSNLLCTEIGRDTWHVKLIDFGIALSTGAPRLTRPGEVLGTLPYMAPEQFAGGVIDRRTDVYGWGVLALELLGGVPAVELFGSQSLAGAPLRDVAPRVLEQARVRPYIVTIVQRCLATQPDERWPDMDAVFSELSDHDDGRAPTLMFQRVVPLAQGHTIVPGAGAAIDAEAATRATQANAAVVEEAAATRIHTPQALPPAEPVTGPPASGERATVLSVALFVLAIIGAFAWVAHARSWWPFAS
jgi:eukaryotic-like serine/threonine-protein kinase